jgi:hypothetical protein
MAAPGDKGLAPSRTETPGGRAGYDPGRDRALLAVEKVSRVMDDMYLDPLLGLAVPWVGDIIGAGVGLYPVVVAWRARAPKVLLARMLLNLSVDLLTGLVPVLGDVSDFFFRANRRNLALLRARLHGPVVRASARDWLVVGGAGALFLGALAAPFVLLALAIAAVL